MKIQFDYFKYQNLNNISRKMAFLKLCYIHFNSLISLNTLSFYYQWLLYLLYKFFFSLLNQILPIKRLLSKNIVYPSITIYKSGIQSYQLFISDKQYIIPYASEVSLQSYLYKVFSITNSFKIIGIGNYKVNEFGFKTTN